uniref:indole-3-pyruvate monooxygenase n=4 Tax=Aegilops tauschii subsp. strangulata TaxID=200361 RepID=A0A453DGW7_AEGTS
PLEMESVPVLIVGAGPAGLATAACLGQFSIPYAIVERESCSASLWRNRAYDRLKLHLAKEFCELPHMSYPVDAPTYIPKTLFVKYLDDYVERFNIQPKYLTSVESSTYDNDEKCWSIVATDMSKCTTVKFTAKFLVVASGENSAENIPMIPGLENFPGDVIHSSSYKSGKSYSGKNVLVVGSGNSGMEIAYDLATHGANTSIVIRSPIHVMTKELIRLGMALAHHLPLNLVDKLLVMAAYLIFGDLSRHGITRPKMGPMTLKSETGRSAVIDVGTVGLIKKGIIKVQGGISKIKGNIVKFQCSKRISFDAIVFATGYKSTANIWLKNGESMLNGNGLPIQKYPNHWKGENGLYCAGLARRGLAGIAADAKNIANDIKSVIDSMSS